MQRNVKFGNVPKQYYNNEGITDLDSTSHKLIQDSMWARLLQIQRLQGDTVGRVSNA